MQRITITIEDDLLEAVDDHAKQHEYQNRSEAMRDLLRRGLNHAVPALAGDREAVAAVVYVYDHHVRELSKRLTETYHHHHAVSLAALHVHLNEETCLEVSVLRGPADEVRHVAEHVVAERGVKHGCVHVLPLPDEAPKTAVRRPKRH